MGELFAPTRASEGGLVESQTLAQRTGRRWFEEGRQLLSSKVAIDLLRVVDFGAVLFAGWLSVLVFAPTLPQADWSRYCLVTLLAGVVLVNVLQIMGVYGPGRVRRPLSGLQDLVVALLVTAAMLIVVAYFTNTSTAFAHQWALSCMLATLAGLIAARAILHLVLKRLRPTSRSGWLCRNVAIVGGGREAARLIDHLAQIGDPHARLIGVFDDRPAVARRALDVGPPVQGGIADLCELARRLPIDTIFIAMPWSAEAELLDVVQRLDYLPVDIRLQLPHLDGDRLLNRRVSYLHQRPFIHVADRPLGAWGCLLKWLEDRVVAVVAIVLTAPLMLLVAAAIKIDSPGPVLFRQKRYGFNNGLIEVLKFRTMRQDACDPNASRLTQRNDPRVTPVGRFLRRTSLDELPQLFNVLRGEMSIVGPRPHALEAKAAERYYHDVVAGYAARHKVKPGITGWAQINGWRGPTDTEEQLRKRIEHDLHYLETWSLGLDLKIMVMTLYRGLVSKNAY